MRQEAHPRYSAPKLSHLGSLTELTLGHGGSSLDGTGLANQKGFGNDANPAVPGGGVWKSTGGSPKHH